MAHPNNSSDSDELSHFSIRIPKKLEGQITARAGVHRRSRNQEIIVLLEMAVDLMVQKDIKLQESHKPDNARW